MTETHSCLVCGNTDFREFLTAKDSLVSGEDFVLKKCNACGFVFTSGPPDEKDIPVYYISKDYIAHSDRRQSLTEYAYHFARNFMLRKKYRLVREVCGRKTGTLLDIGSGTGYFVDFMNSKGWNSTGVEIDDQARKYSIERFAIKAVSPSEIAGIASGSADCITFWHVLEHLLSPVRWMNEVNRIMKDNGRCIIALPNIKSADAEWFGNEWAALDVPRHLWHFSPETLKHFIQNQGFACLEIRPLPLDIYYISTLTYKNRRVKLPLLRGVITGMLLNIRNHQKVNRASSLIYVISKQPA
jgi:2-polyprenyl-3-methyl-5-hydroxy-6-metoxy-1,4-benzoquinol methylase